MRSRWIATSVLLGCLGLPGEVADATTVPPDGGEPVEFGEWTGVRFRIVVDPDWLAADDDHVYVRSAEHVFVLDPRTGVVTTTVKVASDHCQGIGAGLGGVWTCSGTDVIPIDPESGTAGSPIAINKAVEHGHLVTGFDRLWVLTGDGSTLVGLDPETGAVRSETALGARCFDVRVDDASVWLACALDDVVLRVDPVTSGVVDRIEVIEPRGLAFSDGAVWVGAVSAVVRLEAETLEIVATIDGGTGREGGIAADDTGVWVRRAGAPLIRIDTATNEVTDELDLDVLRGGDVLVAHGAVWSTAVEEQALFRIDLGSGR